VKKRERKGTLSVADGYSWYEDDELLALLDRYVGRAADRCGAGRRLKVWLARSEGGDDTDRRPPDAPVAHRSRPAAEIWLTRKEAAEHLGYAKNTLANWALKKEGPPYRRRGAQVMYRLDLLDLWAAGQDRRANQA
jgi:hypothetical protein